MWLTKDAINLTGRFKNDRCGNISGEGHDVVTTGAGKEFVENDHFDHVCWVLKP